MDERASSEPGTRRLWLCGLAMLVWAVSFAWRYPLPGNAGRLRALGGMSGYGTAEFVHFTIGLAALFLLYAVALRESPRLPARRALPVAFSGGAALLVAFAFMYPVNAIDVFIYAVRSRLWTEYGLNPNAALPADNWGDPYMRFASRQWADEASPYGPLWNLVAAPATLVGGDSIGLAVAGYKALAVAAILAGGWVIARTLATARPADAATGVVMYLWNPLVLWEGAGNGHNDAVFALLLLLAVLAWTRGRLALAVPLLVAGGLVKYVSLILLPVVAVALVRQARDRGPGGPSWRAVVRPAVTSAGLSALVVLVGFAPFWDVGAVRASLETQADHFVNSLGALALWELTDRYPHEDVARWVKRTGVGLLLPVLGWAAVAAWRRPAVLPRAVFEVLFAYLLFAAWVFRAWYLIWPLGLAAVLPWGWPTWRMLGWSIGALAAYGLFVWGWEWWGTEYRYVLRAAMPLLYGIPVVLTMAEAGFQRRYRRSDQR